MFSRAPLGPSDTCCHRRLLALLLMAFFSCGSASAESVKAKDDPQSPKATAMETTAFPQSMDEQAAYCLEASFGIARRLTMRLEILRDNRNKGQKILDGATLSASDKTQLVTQMTALSDSIASNDAERKSWNANLQVFSAYMQKNGLLTNNPNSIASMSAQASKDQEAVRGTFNACLRGCPPKDDACTEACNEKAKDTDAYKDMLRCSEIVSRFK
jgi:hypothetical protein